MKNEDRRMDVAPRIAKRVRISGRVQGVNYRNWAWQTAHETGLVGWVRNRADGSVEALIVGNSDAVEKFILHCWDGPPAANVTDISVEAAEGVTPDRFEVKPTV